MEIILIRHGQPEWSRDGLWNGDPPLTGLGRRQAEHLAEAYATLEPTELAVSPKARARETAAPLLARLGRAEQIEPWLEEIRDPDWHGRPDTEASEAYTAATLMAAQERWNGIPGGEPPRHFVRRVADGAAAWLAGHGVRPTDDELPTWEIDDPDRRLVLVAHGGTNGVLICHLLGISPTPWEWERFTHLHTGVTTFRDFRVGDHRAFTLTSLSDVSHLPAELRTG